MPVPPGTETEYPRQRLGTLVPQGFTQEEFAVVRRLVEIILGEDLKRSSEKPAEGAPASIYDEVAEWIDLVVASAPGLRKLARSLPAEQRALAGAYFGSEEPVRHLETFECERVCHEGIAWLGEESQRHFAIGFLDVNPAGQVELVRAISDVRPDKSAIHAGTRLFDFLKRRPSAGSTPRVPACESSITKETPSTANPLDAALRLSPSPMRVSPISCPALQKDR